MPGDLSRVTKADGEDPGGLSKASVQTAKYHCTHLNWCFFEAH